MVRLAPCLFRTRVIQDGVHPSLHLIYKNFDLKQYSKEGWGRRTEGTFRDPGDFGVVTVGCATRWMLSPLKPLLWLTRSTSSRKTVRNRRH